MIGAVLVDDEKKGRDLLINVIDKYCPEVEVVGQAGNIDQAFEVIEDTRPDLVFLDIEMPNGNGFDLLKKFENVFFRNHIYHCLRPLCHQGNKVLSARLLAEANRY